MANSLSLSWFWYTFLVTLINVWIYPVYYFLYLVIIGIYFHVNKFLVSLLHFCVPNHIEIPYKINSMNNCWINEQISISARWAVSLYSYETGCMLEMETTSVLFSINEIHPLSLGTVQQKLTEEINKNKIK